MWPVLCFCTSSFHFIVVISFLLSHCPLSLPSSFFFFLVSLLSSQTLVLLAPLVLVSVLLVIVIREVEDIATVTEALAIEEIEIVDLVIDQEEVSVQRRKKQLQFFSTDRTLFVSMTGKQDSAEKSTDQS